MLCLPTLSWHNRRRYCMYRIFMYANVSVLLKDTADARTRIVCNTVIQLFIMIERKTYENSSYH